MPTTDTMEPIVSERRRWPRYKINICLPFSVKFRNRLINSIYIKNLSLGGMMGLLPEELNIGEKVKISINLPAPDKNIESTEVFFDAKVVWVEEHKKIKDRKYRKTGFEIIDIERNFGTFLQAYLDLERSRGHAVKLR